MAQSSNKENGDESKSTKDNVAENSFLKKNIVSLCTLILLIALSSVIIFLLLKQNCNSSEAGKDHETDPEANLTLSSKLKLVSRLEWVAQPPVDKLNILSTPVPYVIIHHTATENCSSQVQCVSHVRLIQNFHMESRHWWDIGYNFLVGGDGKAYEGRGWISQGAHTYGYNAKSIGIAFIGHFNTNKPLERQITACKLLISKGVELGYIKKDYKLFAARQLQTSQSPGTKLYEELKTWNHWSSSL